MVAKNCFVFQHKYYGSLDTLCLYCAFYLVYKRFMILGSFGWLSDLHKVCCWCIKASLILIAVTTCIPINLAAL